MKSIVPAIIAFCVIATACYAQLNSATADTSTTAQDAKASEDEEFKAAKIAESSGDGVTMLTHSKRLVEQYPQSSLAYRCLADAYYYMDFIDESLTAVRKAIELKPQDVMGWHDLGTVLFKQNKVEDAFAAFKKAIEVGADDPIAWSDIAGLFSSQTKKELAIQSAKRACDLLSTKPFNNHSGEFQEVGLWKSLGETYYRCNEWAEATRCFKRAITIQPDNARIWYALSVMYEKQGSRTEAIAALQRALKIMPDFPAAQNALETMTASPIQPAQPTQQAPVQQTPQSTTEQIDQAQKMINLLKSMQDLSSPQNQQDSRHRRSR